MQRSKAVAVLLCLLLLAGGSRPGRPDDAVSREVSAFNDLVDETSFTDAVSREVSVFNDLVDKTFFADAVSREVSVFNDLVDKTSFTDAVSREVSIFNDVIDEISFTDAVSREVSVSNDVIDETSFTDVVSREVSIFNDVIDETSFADAMSREISVFNDVIDETSFTDADSREVSIFNDVIDETSFGDAISREVSVLNDVTDMDLDGVLTDDGDGTSDPCRTGQQTACDDNCPTVFNPDQRDADADGTGDACDLNDGFILIAKMSRGRVEWQNETGFTRFNLYRGSLDHLSETGEYTQDPLLEPEAAHWCDLVTSTQLDSHRPPAGRGNFYLVTGENLGGEGTLGQRSDGSERPNSHPCP